MSATGVGHGPLVETTEARNAFAGLFQDLYGIAEPVLPLERVLHWADVVRRLGVNGTLVDRTLTYFLAGYFYNTSTPAPSAAEIAEALAAGAAQGVQQFLVPTVRNQAGTDALEAHGFQRIPWVVESIFRLEGDLDNDLERRLRRHRFRSIQKVTRHAEERYPAEFYEWAELQAQPGVLDAAAALHAHNMAKYRHALNFYSAPLLRRLSETPLGKHLLLCIRRDNVTGEAVQASISLIDRGRSQLYHLVHGIHREGVAPGYNLFIATVYQVFAYAERNGIREINLGRGAPEQKLALGANRFVMLNNWILNPSPAAASEIATLSARTREALRVANSRMPLVGPYRVE